MKDELSYRIATLRNEYLRLHKKDRVVWHTEGEGSNAKMEDIMAIHVEDAKTLEKQVASLKAELDQCLTVHAELNDEHEKLKTKLDWMKVKT